MNIVIKNKGDRISLSERKNADYIYIKVNENIFERLKDGNMKIMDITQFQTELKNLIHTVN